MTLLDEGVAAVRVLCARRGHRLQTARSMSGRYTVRRCVACGHVERRVHAGGPIIRAMAWLDRQLVEREPWTSELAYNGPLQLALTARVAGGGDETITLRLRPRSWRLQGDGRVTELGSLGGDTFRVVWRDLRQRVDALTGGWPDYGDRDPVATIRVRADGPHEASGEILRGTITVIDVTQGYHAGA